MSGQITLNPDQERAKAEILAARNAGDFHLLTGFAGSGKTTLIQDLAAHWQARGVRIVLTAPTHKAVAVLARKLGADGLEVSCQTIHKL
jgi:exodeoxyribonuclease-5